MNINKLQVVVEKSNAVFEKLKIKYPKLDGYLVFSPPFGKCELTNNMAEILKKYPQMIVDCKQKDKGLQLLQKIAEIESENKKNINKPKSFEKYKIQLSEVINDLEIKEDTFVEIRFKNTDLDLIFELQKDELISQKHTPQTKASIMIVLGTIEELYLMNL
jgi:hypothetical protein